jgi:hypothetical protein
MASRKRDEVFKALNPGTILFTRIRDGLQDECWNLKALEMETLFIPKFDTAWGIFRVFRNPGNGSCSFNPISRIDLDDAKCSFESLENADCPHYPSSRWTGI